jgi:hypothetical protein
VRKLFGIVSILVAGSVQAQALGWNVSEVLGKDKTPVGYIYHSSAVGTQVGTKTEKVITGLRLVCSIKSSEGPAIALYWNGMFGNTPQSVDVKVDGRKIAQSTPWDQDGPLLFRKIADSQELMQGLKTGRAVSFEWTQSGVKRTTVISLKDFNSGFGEFKTSCKTQI